MKAYIVTYPESLTVFTLRASSCSDQAFDKTSQRVDEEATKQENRGAGSFSRCISPG